LKVATFTSFAKIKVQKKSLNIRNQGYSYYFCLMIEGSGSGSGSVTLTNGSGSGRLKNMWIRIRILNTAKQKGSRVYLLFLLDDRRIRISD
jgi:hypothetical protein